MIIATSNPTGMLGYAPLNKVYNFSHLTRCMYATLAEMARNGGDLAFSNVGLRRRARMEKLARRGLVRQNWACRRWELTAEGWAILRDAEACLALAEEERS